METEPLFYRLDSDLGVSNLQLYAFHKAAECWQEVVNDHRSGRPIEELRERYVFIVATMGLSVSQLLGQNPVKVRPRVDSPKDLFASFAVKYGFDEDFQNDFDWFVDYYDAVRHFGVVQDGSRHHEIKGLTFEVTKRHFDIGRRVWDEVLAVHGRELGGRLRDLDLDDLDVLADTVYEEVDHGRLTGPKDVDE